MTRVTLNTQHQYPVENLFNGRSSTAETPVQQRSSRINNTLSSTQGKLARSRFDLLQKKTRSPETTRAAGQQNLEQVSFVQNGSKYYFPPNANEPGTPQKLAFEDVGNQIVASSEDSQAAREMVKLAIQKKWTPINVQGSDAFKKAVEEAAKELNVPVITNTSPQPKNGSTLTGESLKKVEIAKQKNCLQNGAVFSGHGEFRNYGKTVVPEGTSITFYSEHGAKISDELGNMIEEQKDVSKLYKKTYKAGESIPNYMLLPPGSLNIKGDAITVDQPTPLSSLLKPDMGKVSWAACTFDPTANNSKKEYHIDGIVDREIGKYVTRYN